MQQRQNIHTVCLTLVLVHRPAVGMEPIDTVILGCLAIPPCHMSS